MESHLAQASAFNLPAAAPAADERRRVLILSESAGLRDLYQAALADSGYATRAGNYGESDAFQSFRPDLIIVCCNSREILSTDGEQVQPSADLTLAWQTPILLVTERWREADALLLKNEIHDWVLPTESPIIVQKVRSLLRQSAFATELLRRQEAAAQLGVAIRPRSQRLGRIPGREAPIVFFGPPSIDHKKVVEIASKSSREFVSTYVQQTAFEYLNTFPRAAVIVDYSSDPETANAFIHTLRSTRELARTPIFVMAESFQRDEALAFIRLGLTDAILKPVQADYLRMRIDALTLQSARNSLWYELYAQKGFDKFRDKRTQLFTRDYFEAYLNEMIEDVNAIPQSTSVLLYEFQTDAGEVDPEMFHDPMPEFAAITQRVIRLEDFATLIGKNRILVTLPHTREGDAGTANWRLTSVLKSTEFLGHSGEWRMRTARTLLRPTDTVDDLLVRLNTDLKAG